MHRCLRSGEFRACSAGEECAHAGISNLLLQGPPHLRHAARMAGLVMHVLCRV